MRAVIVPADTQQSCSSSAEHRTGPDRAGRPPAVGEAHLDRVVEGGRDLLGGEHLGDGTGSGQPTVGDERGMRGGLRNLLEMVGDQQCCQLRRAQRQGIDGFEQLFAGGDVETCGRFVEEAKGGWEGRRTSCP